MPDRYYDKHKETLQRARQVIVSREFWSPYPESPRAYAEDAPAIGEAAFEDRLGKRFAIDQAADRWSAGAETSAYGRHLGVSYPIASVDALLAAANPAPQKVDD